MEAQQTRRVHPALALLAGLLQLGLGYVYIGRIRSAFIGFAVIYTVLLFLSWTRLVTYSVVFLWFSWAWVILLYAVILIHPVVLAARRREVPQTRYNRWWFYVLWVVAASFLGLLLATNRATWFGYEPFRIPSKGMSPTVEEGDFVLADSWRYRHHEPVIGEIVIVERPETRGVKYIKRVVAVGGDSVEMRDGVIYRNGQAIEEPYIHAPLPYSGSPRNFPPSTLAPGEIYVLGDYRDNSMDSRQWGPFRTSSLRGRVQYVWLSIDQNNRIRWQRLGTR
jgi:signal peptidase I